MKLRFRKSWIVSFKGCAQQLFIALTLVSLAGCTTRLRQTECERSILDCHRDINRSAWRYGDPFEKAHATADAQKRWPEFVKAFNSWSADSESKGSGDDKLTKEERFEVKVPLTVLLTDEDIWLRVTAIGKDTVTGKLDANPVIFSWYKEGSMVTIPIRKIEDWVYGQDEWPTGAFTTSVIRKDKLRELNQLVIVDGQPTLASIITCNNYWQNLTRKIDKMSFEQFNKPSKQDEKEIGLLYSCRSMIDDETNRFKATNKNIFSQKELAEACGLPLSTIQLIETAEEHFRVKTCKNTK